MKIITLGLEDDVIVLLGWRWSWTQVCISGYRPKTRQLSNIWGVAEAMLSQVGRPAEPGRGKKKKERAGLHNGVRVFIRASEMACLPPTALEFPFEVIWFLHSCHAPPLTPRWGSPPLLYSHRIVQSSDSQTGVWGCREAIKGALRAARDSLISSKILLNWVPTDRMWSPGNLWIMSRYLGTVDVKIFENCWYIHFFCKCTQAWTQLSTQLDSAP